MGFSSLNSVEKTKCQKLQKVEKQLQHELFRYKVRLVTVYDKFPWAFLLVNSVIEEIAKMKGYSRLGLS